MHIITTPRLKLVSFAFLCVLFNGCGFHYGPSPVIAIVIDEPQSNAVLPRTATFRWHIEQGSNNRESYVFRILVDKGPDACDGRIEFSGGSGTNGCKTIEFPWFTFGQGESAEYAIDATDSKGNRVCERIGGLRIDFKLPIPKTDPCTGLPLQ